MLNIFYFGDNDTVHGPVTELEVQRWYLNGYYSSDAKFQITSSKKFEPKEPIYTLGDLIDLNGRTVPFYFSSEKIDREKKVEESLAILMQEVELLRKNDQSMKQSLAITALKTHVTELMESNASLQKQVDALSNKMETSPATDQLEKKVNELKKRVDEQEKKVDSMKKEISAVNSKCDRNNSKLDKLIERQNSTEGTVTGFDQRIAELKTSEKTTRESISACEQNAESNSSGLQTITSVLSTIKKEMESQREEFSTNQAERRSILVELQNTLMGMERNEELGSEYNSASEDAPQELANRTLSEPGTSKKSASAGTVSDILPCERKDSKKHLKAGDVSSRSEKSAANVPTVTRVKDWAAICQELSDDVEEDDEKPADPLASTADLAAWTALFVRDFVELLKVYCAALDSADYTPLKQESASFDYTNMRQFYMSCDRQAPHYVRIREAIVTEVRRLADTTIFCSVCWWATTSPRHLFYHFTNTDHIHRKLEDHPLMNEAYSEMSCVISAIFLHFIASSEEFTVALSREHQLAFRGRILASQRLHRLADFRPTTQFMTKAVAVVTELKLTHLNAHNLPTESINPDDMGNRKKEVAETIRKYFACTKRKAMFKKKFEKHVADGVLACAACRQCFEDAEEYYKHMTTYDHAIRDQSIFTMCMWIWKGHEYWDAML